MTKIRRDPPRSPPPASQPAAAAPPRTGAAKPIRTNADRFEPLRGGDGPLSPAAVANYQHHGDVRRTLNPAGVRDVIAHSPQVDDLTATTGDRVRCGGASVLNGMLLDGGHAASSAALGALARDSRAPLGRPVTPAESTALTQLARGRISPHEAATLQQLTFDLGVAGSVHPERARTAGLSGQDMVTLTSRLRAADALQRTSELNFRSSTLSNGALHWTVTSTTPRGVVAVNSAPGSNGLAGVLVGSGPTEPRRNGELDPSFAGDVTMRSAAGGADYRLRAVSGNNLMTEMTWPARNGHAVDHSGHVHVDVRDLTSGRVIATRDR